MQNQHLGHLVERRGRRARRGAWGSLALALCAGCGSEPESRWIDLSEGFRPRPLEELVAEWSVENPDREVTTTVAAPGQPEIWIETELQRKHWIDGRAPTFWSPVWPPVMRRLPKGPVRLALSGEGYERVGQEEELSGNVFHINGNWLQIFLPEGEEPPETSTAAVLAGNGREVDGAWRVVTEKHAGEGIPVWAGEAEELELDLPPQSTLRFVTYFDHAMFGTESSATFRVLLDEVPLLEHEQAGGVVSHAVDLPAAGVDGARLRFEVDEKEKRGLGIFFDPVIGPADPGTYGNRPWGQTRPDIVLFVADTFRADGLAAYGGDSSLAPNLNALAERARVFLGARSPSAWTLPSLSSLFTSFHPGQHGAVDEGLTLPRSIDTLAELLARHGYRTGAITDSAFFRVSFGLDQGFQWFTQHDPPVWDLDQTIDDALAFVDQDDGRPLFLVVHSYRTHAPYRTGPDEDQSAWDRMIEEAQAEIDRADPPLTPPQKKERMIAMADPWRALYLDAVTDLDRGFGRLERGLAERGVLENGYLIFTSDHGEAFGENHDIHHGGRLWDVKLRIPLVVSGHDVDPGEVPWSASLIDVVPTVAELAGLPPQRDWMGTDLLSLSEERPHFAFRLEKKRELAIHDGPRKILAAPDPDALERGELVAAFDLEADPGEEVNLLEGEGIDWPVELGRRMAEIVKQSLAPRATSTALQADPEIQRNLEDIGYGGEDDG